MVNVPFSQITQHEKDKGKEYVERPGKEHINTSSSHVAKVNIKMVNWAEVVL